MPSHPDRVRRNYDWKDIPAVVTQAEIDAFDLDEALRNKRIQSDEAFKEFKRSLEVK